MFQIINWLQLRQKCTVSAKIIIVGLVNMLNKSWSPVLGLSYFIMLHFVPILPAQFVDLISDCLWHKKSVAPTEGVNPTTTFQG